MSWTILTGDCVEQMRELADESIDAVVCDPPYGIGFMGHEWDQPGEYAAVRGNGNPGVFASGKPYPGNHALGGRDRPPPGQRRDRQPEPSGFTAKDKKLGARGTSRDRGGAMEAGRYDLSLTANRRFQGWCEAWAAEALRVLKPGGHLLASCGTRTYHRLAAGIEDAGFEIRDEIMWLYGSGFPKSLDVAKAIDRAAGVEGGWRREDHPGRAGARVREDPAGARIGQTFHDSDENPEGLRHVYEPATEEARRWQGFGTALKPSHEPVVVARKPFAGTVAETVLTYGTGAINIDGCRIGFNSGADRASAKPGGVATSKSGGDPTPDVGRGLDRDDFVPTDNSIGRWPANVALSHTPLCVQLGVVEVASDGHFPAARGPSGYGSNGQHPESSGGGLKGHEGLEERHMAGELVEAWECAPGCPVAALDAQSGTLRSGANPTRRGADKFRDVYGDFKGQEVANPARGADAGGASRFFYCAKTSQSERDAGLLEGLPRTRNARKRSQQDRADRWRDRARNRHPTVKPIDLMRWLLRMVTPPGGTVLDPFTGSGSTGCAAMLEGLDFVGIDRERGYALLAEARVRWWEQHRGREAERPRRYWPTPGGRRRRGASKQEDAGQLALLG